MAVQMFDSDACIWTRHFIEEALDTALHEWFHFASFMQRGPPADRLREEFVACLLGQCVVRAINGTAGVFNRSFPGLFDLPVQPLLTLVDDGQLPPTIAARYFAHLYADADPAAPTLAPASSRTSLDCKDVTHTYPDPRAVAPLLKQSRRRPLEPNTALARFAELRSAATGSSGH